MEIETLLICWVVKVISERHLYLSAHKSLKGLLLGRYFPTRTPVQRICQDDQGTNLPGREPNDKMRTTEL